jgi:hypothetical protein
MLLVLCEAGAHRLLRSPWVVGLPWGIFRYIGEENVLFGNTIRGAAISKKLGIKSQ